MKIYYFLINLIILYLNYFLNIIAIHEAYNYLIFYYILVIQIILFYFFLFFIITIYYL